MDEQQHDNDQQSSYPLILPDVTIVDLSHWNPESESNFVQAKAAGCGGIITKLIQNGVQDPQAIYHLYNAYEAGIELLGIYDFGTASDDVKDFITAALEEFTTLNTRLIMLDAEKSPQQMTVKIAEEFCETINKEEGRYPTLYMGRDGPDGTQTGLPSEILSKCDLMLPAYGPHDNNLGSILPPGFRLPKSDTDRGGAVRLWQFTDGNINGGEFPGLGRVDQSKAVGFSGYEALKTWWQGSAG